MKTLGLTALTYSLASLLSLTKTFKQSLGGPSGGARVFVVRHAISHNGKVKNGRQRTAQVLGWGMGLLSLVSSSHPYVVLYLSNRIGMNLKYFLFPFPADTLLAPSPR